MNRTAGSRRTLVFGLTLIALVFAVQAVIDRYLTQAADAQARQMEQSSVLRVELLGRIVHDIDERRILIGYHIIESDAQTMAQVERQIAENADDFRQARDHFIQRLDAANQLSLWRTADAQLAWLERAETEVLELSRADDSGGARSALRKLHPRYEELESVLEQLIELSRQSALVSMARVQELQAETNRVIWAVAMAGVAALAVLGAWLLRRISAYELRVAQHSAELEQRNRDLDAFAGLITVDLRAGRPKDAVAYIDAVLARGKASPDQLLIAAGGYASAGFPEKAETLLRKAIEIDPSRLEPYARLGGLYAGQQRVAEAKAQFEAILERNPRSVEASTMLALMLQRQGLLAEAERQFEKTLSIDSRAAARDSR